MQHTVILCHFVPPVGMLCHLGGWDMGADPCSTSHINCSKLRETFGILDNSGVGVVEQSSSNDSDFANQNFLGCVCHLLGGFCQLEFWKNCQRKHDKSG